MSTDVSGLDLAPRLGGVNPYLRTFVLNDLKGDPFSRVPLLGIDFTQLQPAVIAHPREGQDRPSSSSANLSIADISVHTRPFNSVEYQFAYKRPTQEPGTTQALLSA